MTIANAFIKVRITFCFVYDSPFIVAMKTNLRWFTENKYFLPNYILLTIKINSFVIEE